MAGSRDIRKQFMASENPIQIAILAPTLAVRVGLRTLLEASESIRIVAEIADPANLEDAWLDVDALVIQGKETIDRVKPVLNDERRIGLLWISDDLQGDLFQKFSLF